MGARLVIGLTYGAEAEGVHLDTERGHVLLLELARQVALDEGGLDVAGPGQSGVRSMGAANPAAARAARAIRMPVDAGDGELTLPVPPSPTRTNLKVGIS